MQFVIDKNHIVDMLANVQGITGRKTSLAITENLLLKVSDNNLSVCATDIETGFEGTYPAEIEKAGEIAVNARDLFNIVKKIKNDRIFFRENKKQWIEITDLEDGSNLKYNIVGANPEDFPALPQIENITYFEMDSQQFRKMVSWAVLVMFSGDEKRTHVLGTNLEYQEDADQVLKLRMISTDGKRLTKTEMPYSDTEKIGMQKGESVIIPKKALNEVLKFLKKTGAVNVGVKDNYCVVKKDNEKIYINLLSGSFPDLSGVFSAGDKYVIRVDKGELREMLERMSILTSEDYKGVIFRFEENYMYINAANPDKGESYEYMKIDFNRDKIETMFNPHYFIDALNIIEEEMVSMKIKDGQSACILCGVENENDINIIMPMKI